MTSTEKMKKALKRKPKVEKAPVFVSTGSTLLNLGITGHPDRGFRAGQYAFIVGDSQSGKTFLSLTCLAEAAINPAFDDYRFIYDQPEHGALMDFSHYFGAKVAERVEMPDPSETSEQFYDRQEAYLDDGRPFISILDSMDSLDADADIKHRKKAKAAKSKGEEGKGTYGMDKAKTNSTRLRSIARRLPKTGSILIIISQTRDNVGVGYSEKTRAGGRALRFYASVELWSSIRQHINKTINGKPREIGIISKVVIKKNRETGKNRWVELPIYHSTGFADTDACVNFLVDESHWDMTKKGIITAPEFSFEGRKEKLIHTIEGDDSLWELKAIVNSVWQGIEEKTIVKRRRRYE